ncbi:MAG: hypothetical protein ACKVIF_05855, partial [Rhodospirillales bacterium]
DFSKFKAAKDFPIWAIKAALRLATTAQNRPIVVCGGSDHYRETSSLMMRARCSASWPRFKTSGPNGPGPRTYVVCNRLQKSTFTLCKD